MGGGNVFFRLRYIGVPLWYTVGISQVLIELQGGEKFKIITENNSEKNIYIESVTLNGKNYNNSYITHKDITNGGELKFVMSDTPNKAFGKDYKNRPKSIVY